MFYKIFLSPQAKRWVSITYKHDIYELPNNLRLLRKLGNQEILEKCLTMIAQCPVSPPKPKLCRY